MKAFLASLNGLGLVLLALAAGALVLVLAAAGRVGALYADGAPIGPDDVWAFAACLSALAIALSLTHVAGRR